MAGHGYDITAADVWLAYRSAIQAAENLGRADAKKQPIRDLVSGEAGDRFVSRVLGAELDLPRRK